MFPDVSRDDCRCVVSIVVSLCKGTESFRKIKTLSSSYNMHSLLKFSIDIDGELFVMCFWTSECTSDQDTGKLSIDNDGKKQEYGLTRSFSEKILKERSIGFFIFFIF